MFNTKNFINWLAQFGQESPAELYHPYRIDDYLVVLGECIGIVVYPIEYTNNIGELKTSFEYFKLSEDDCYYFIDVSRDKYKNIWCLEEEIKCFQTAMDYIKKYATTVYYNGVADYELPWHDNTTD